MSKAVIKFHSKRNCVYRDEDKVYKRFENASEAQTEAAFLRMLLKKGVPVPVILHNDDQVLVMEYIRGVTIPDLLCGSENPDWHQVAAAVIRWLQSFYDAICHETTGEIRGDVNGRNFIFYAGNVWGVDFEEHTYGTRETDAGRLLAYAATYDVSDESKKIALSNALERQFVDVMKLDRQMITSECKKELLAISQRRKR